MRAILFGAIAAPYDITDEKTGKLNSGVSGKLWFAKVKRSAKDRDVKYSVGWETKTVKCDENLAKACREELTKAGEPIVCNLDLEVSGTGATSREVCTDFELDGPLSKYTLTLAGGLVRREPPATERRLPATNGQSGLPGVPSQPRPAAV